MVHEKSLVLAMAALLLIASACVPTGSPRAMPVPGASAVRGAASRPSGDASADANPGALATSGLSPLAPVSPPAAPGAAELRLTVLHTNDTWGYLLPCG